MDLGMFDRFHPSLQTRVSLDERIFDMSRSDKNSEKYVIPMHRTWIFGLISVCRILERIFYRLATMILVRSTGKAGDHFKEKED